ncbi:MAG TPA: hypothetical protein PLP57_01260 [Candidatus Saccharicenans sp.]|jgi:hypothetical protein|nr:hypothetical protein [Candidatus Saccharicenans sp.]HRD01255.1 hypothetical protein [Candidatus Saccharicenans sp.]
MEEKKYTSLLPRVQAPDGFENQVLRRLREKKARATRQVRWVWGLAGVAAVLLVVIVLILPGTRQLEYSASQFKEDSSAVETIQIVEALNLENEIRRATDDPQTVFILEQVSDRALVQQVRY